MILLTALSAALAADPTQSQLSVYDGTTYSVDLNGDTATVAGQVALGQRGLRSFIGASVSPSLTADSTVESIGPASLQGYIGYSNAYSLLDSPTYAAQMLDKCEELGISPCTASSLLEADTSNSLGLTTEVDALVWGGGIRAASSLAATEGESNVSEIAAEGSVFLPDPSAALVLRAGGELGDESTGFVRLNATWQHKSHGRTAPRLDALGAVETLGGDPTLRYDLRLSGLTLSSASSTSATVTGVGLRDEQPISGGDFSSPQVYLVLGRTL